MKYISVLRFLVFLVVVLSCANWIEATVYDLYYLGGQSNMDGYGRIEDLPEELAGPVEGVMIFHGNTSADATPIDGRGVWAGLRPGHGVGYQFDGKSVSYSDRFGVELTFARTLQKLDPEAKIAIIKYSRGGTSIDRAAASYFGCWEPEFPGGKNSGINQYDHFLATVRSATSVADIDGDGEPDILVPKGIVWMQGESDAAYTVEIANRYEHHLARLMDLIRAALRADDLPVVVGRISDSGIDDEEMDGKVWNHGEIVRAAQGSFVARDGHAALVTSTDDYDYSDRWHYNSAGYIDLGKEFAAAVHGLHPDVPFEVADPDPLRFQSEINAFSRWEGKNTPAEDSILFVGSSSIRYWSTASSFPSCQIVNRGFGGAHISDVHYFYDDVVVGYRPKAIVFYAGDNDVGAGKSPNRVLADFKAFFDNVRRDLPDTPVYFLAIKPSGRRWHLWRNMDEANSLVRSFTESHSDLVFVDVATPMLGDDGNPREELFVGDRLHMNAKGYALWNSIIGPMLATYCE